MGNTNESPYNSNNSHLESNNNNHHERETVTNKPGFFQSIMCCGQDTNSNDFSGKNDFLKLEFYWFYQSDPQSSISTQINIAWVPYSIELNNIIENAYLQKKQFCTFNFPEIKYLDFMIEFQTMMQVEVKNKGFANNLADKAGGQLANATLKVRRIHKDEEKIILRKHHLENINFLNNVSFIRDYNNTHNIQSPIRLASFFRHLAFPIKCLDVFNQEIFLPSEMISLLQKIFINYRINSFAHLKQILTQEIFNEAERLNNILNRNNFVFENKQNEGKNTSNYILQADIYNELIELNMNQDNLEAIIIYLFNLEGFIFERINECLRNNTIEATDLKLFFVILQACVCKQGQNDAYRFIKSNSLFTEGPNKKKHLRLYKGCYLDSDMIQKYLNMLKPLENKQTDASTINKSSNSLRIF